MRGARAPGARRPWVGAPRGRRCGPRAATFPERRPCAAPQRAVCPGEGRFLRAACPGGSSSEPRDSRGPPVTRPLRSAVALSSGVLPPSLPAVSAGAMERAAGPLRNAFSDRVLESKAPGAPLDCGVPGHDQRAEPRAPWGDHAGAPHPGPVPPRCPGGAFLPATPHPEERRALGVRPEPAGSALAELGQPPDSARWMLCVAGAKLKVSGVWARSPGSAAGGEVGADGGGGGRLVCGSPGP